MVGAGVPKQVLVAHIIPHEKGYQLVPNNDAYLKLNPPNRAGHFSNWKKNKGARATHVYRTTENVNRAIETEIQPYVRDGINRQRRGDATALYAGKVLWPGQKLISLVNNPLYNPRRSSYWQGRRTPVRHKLAEVSKKFASMLGGSESASLLKFVKNGNKMKAKADYNSLRDKMRQMGTLREFERTTVGAKRLTNRNYNQLSNDQKNLLVTMTLNRLFSHPPRSVSGVG